MLSPPPHCQHLPDSFHFLGSQGQWEQWELYVYVELKLLIPPVCTAEPGWVKTLGGCDVSQLHLYRHFTNTGFVDYMIIIYELKKELIILSIYLYLYLWMYWYIWIRRIIDLYTWMCKILISLINCGFYCTFISWSTSVLTSCIKLWLSLVHFIVAQLHFIFWSALVISTIRF